MGQINKMTFAGIEPGSLAYRASVLPTELGQLTHLVIDNGHPEFHPRNLHWESNTEPTLPMWLPLPLHQGCLFNWLRSLSTDQSAAGQSGQSLVGHGWSALLSGHLVSCAGWTDSAVLASPMCWLVS